MSTFLLVLLCWVVISFLLGPLCLYVVSEPSTNDETPSIDPRHRGMAA